MNSCEKNILEQIKIYSDQDKLASKIDFDLKFFVQKYLQFYIKSVIKCNDQ